jgi:L,D-peptidoglycan transpeptidase YkuD (ErfK/YbiS/YcfS/YnhG family)
MLLIKNTFLIAATAAVLATSATVRADGEVPASLIRVPESTTTLFVAETSTALFHRFDRTSNGLVLSSSHYMSIGSKGSGKQRSGDRRTPLGAYFVTEQLDTSQLHDKYGVTAFPLDYPNVWDRLAMRDGDGIWIHGVLPGGERRPELDTDGCIALPNEDLSVLAPVFSDNVTPVLVTLSVDWVEEASNLALRSELENKIAEWADSQQSGDLYTYLSLYSDEFARWGMNKAEWSSLRMQSINSRVIERLDISDLLLLGYPEEDGLFLSRFQVETQVATRTIVSRTRLYWRRDANGALKIVAEDVG